MRVKTILRKTLSILMTTGATIAVGFLAFAGMFMLSWSTIPLCISALIFAVIYEGQVYHQGISTAFRRIFDRKYLKRGIARRYINKQIKHEIDIPDDRFLKTYHQHQQYLIDIENYKKTVSLTVKQKQKIARAKKNLTEMEDFFISELSNKSRSLTERQNNIRKIISDSERAALLKEMNRKKWIIRVASVFALGAGISAGFTGFTVIQGGIVALGVASVIPGGVIIMLATFAAVGYALMCYQTMTDMIQKHKGNVFRYLHRQHKLTPEGEEHKEHIFIYGLRVAAVVIAIGFAIFATATTAGTWWGYTQDGAVLLKIGETVTNWIRNISVPLMTVSEFFYNTVNSAQAANTIFKNFIPMLKNTWAHIKKVTAEENYWQFLNPFRAIAHAIDYGSKGLSFLGHCFVTGVSTEILGRVPKWLNITGSAINEAGVDLSYLIKDGAHEHEHHDAHDAHHHHHDTDDDEEHDHNHDSKILDAMFFVPKVIALSFKAAGVAWDTIFSTGFWQAPIAKFSATWSNAWKKAFPKHEETTPKAEPKMPYQSMEEWRSTHSMMSRNVAINVRRREKPSPQYSPRNNIFQPLLMQKLNNKKGVSINDNHHEDNSHSHGHAHNHIAKRY